ncbi:hypothetical protein ACH4SK_16685 [Streptomyces inhibens]
MSKPGTAGCAEDGKPDSRSLLKGLPKGTPKDLPKTKSAKTLVI